MGRVFGVSRGGGGASLGNLGSLRVGIDLPLKKWDKNYKSITTDVKKYPKTTDKALKRAGKAWDKHAGAIKAASIGMIAFGTATTIAFGMAVNEAATFQQSMVNTQAVVGATSDELQELTGFAREMGKQTVFSATESATAMNRLGSAGLNTKEIMNSLKGTLDLAAATNADLAFTAQTVASTLSQFGFAASESGRIANVFTATISASQATMDKLSTSMSIVGPVAKSVGLSLEETAGILGALFNAGLDASTAGTSLRQSIAQLLKPTDDAKEALRRLNVETIDSNGQLRSLTDIIRDLETTGLSAADALTIFGVRAGPGMLALVSKGADAIEDLTARVTDTDKAAEIAALQIGTFQGQTKLLKSAVSELKITIGNQLLPVLTKYTTKLTGIINRTSDWAAENPKLTKTLVSLGAATGIVVGVVGSLGLVAGPLAKGLGLLKGAALGVAGALSLPVWGTIGIIAAGLAAVAGSAVLVARDLSKAKKELQSLGPAIKIQTNNMAKIQVGIDDWRIKLQKLTEAQATGTTHTQRFNQATQEWVDIPIATRIGEAQFKIVNLGMELRKAGGDFDGISEETKKFGKSVEDFLVKAINIAQNPMKAITSAMGGLGTETATTSEAFLSLRGNMDFLSGIDLTKFEQLFGTRDKIQEILDKGMRGRPPITLPPAVLPIDISAARKDLEKQTQLAQFKAGLKELFQDPFKQSGAFIEKQKQKAIKANREQTEADIKEIGRRNKAAEVLFIQDTENNRRAVEKAEDIKQSELEKTAKFQEGLLEKTRKDNKQTASEIARIWDSTANSIKGSMSDLFATMIDPSIETDWRQLWGSLKSIAINALADIAAAEAFKAITQIAKQIPTGKGGNLGELIAGAGETAATTGAVTSSPTASTAIGSVSGGATLGSIFAAVVAPAAILAGSIATVVQSERDFNTALAAHENAIADAVRKGIKINEPFALLPTPTGIRGIEVSNPELAAFLAAQTQIDPGRQIRTRQPKEPAKPRRTRQPKADITELFKPRRPVGTDRFGRPIDDDDEEENGDASMAPAAPRQTGDVIITLNVVVQGQDIRDMDIADWQRLFREKLEPAVEAEGKRFLRADNLMAS